MKRIKGDWALVTGAGSGLGSMLAERLAEAGYNLILISRSLIPLQKVADNLKRFTAEIQTLAVDIGASEAISKIQEICAGKDLCLLVNNAGVVAIKPLSEMTVSEIEFMMRTNLMAPILLTQALLPQLTVNGGTIVNINSTAGKKPVKHHVVYSASKYGLRGFGEALRLELKEQNVRVIDVYPGGMKTNLHQRSNTGYDTTSFLQPEKVAEMIVSAVQLPSAYCVADLTIERMSG